MNLILFLQFLFRFFAQFWGSLLTGLIYCFLTVTLRANQNVTGLAITTFGVGFGNFFGSSLVKITGSDIPSVALTRTSAFFTKKLPIAETTGWFGKIFLSYGFLTYAAIIIALLVAFFLKKTRGGLHLRAVGKTLQLPMQQVSVFQNQNILLLRLEVLSQVLAVFSM